jgi:hypothetical protein
MALEHPFSFTIAPPSPPQAPSWPSSSPRERFLALVDQAALELEAEMRAPSLYQQGQADERQRVAALLAARLAQLPPTERAARAELRAIRAMLTPQT